MYRPRIRLPVLISLLVLLLVSGCSSNGPTPNPDAGVPDTNEPETTLDAHVDATSDTSPDGTSSDTFVPPDHFSWDALPDQHLPPIGEMSNGWHELFPGGATTCSRGSTYAFLFRKGTENKVVINFEGGGACWNQLTCSIADAIFKDNVQGTHDGFVAGYSEGIFDHDNEAHPFKDWHHLYIPYCTGDIHIGNASVTYGAGDDAFEIQHKGSVNASAALDWLYENVDDPEKVFVTGCSAGSYGSAFWVPFVTQQYPDAAVYQMGDSGCGVITQSFLNDSFPVWNAEQNLPEWIEGLDPAEINLSDLTIADYYIRVATHYPDQFFSQFTSLFDNNQAFYFKAMGGGDDNDWSLVMREYILQILEDAPNFKVYIGPGDAHCIIPYPEFFTIKVNDVLLTDWIKDVVSDKDVDNQLCTDCDLSPPPVTDAGPTQDGETNDTAESDSVVSDEGTGDGTTSDSGPTGSDAAD